MKGCLVVFLVLACLGLGPAVAKPISVTSGEHGDFTRLVLEIGTQADWTMGRTADGYELRLGKDKRDYDLTRVFQLIPRTRLAAIWVDDGSGNLNLGIGCACHAIPFEFRPGTIVIDLRDGPPPEGSSFETALVGARSSDVIPTPDPHRSAVAAKLDWRRMNQAAGFGEPTGANFPMPSRYMDLAPLRDTLLRQLSEAAARGVVDMTLPQAESSISPNSNPQIGPLRQIRIGDDLGFAAGAARQLPDELTGDGSNCIASDVLDIGRWGQDTPVIEQMSGSLTNLTGEFDRPNSAAIEKAVRFYLFLGFGSEARQLMAAMATGADQAAVWTSMAMILDGETSPDGPFDQMQVCDTAAAMWSVLSRPGIAGGPAPNAAAVVRTFSALPLHLRRLLAPPLSERFLTVGDTETARALQDAVLRAPGDPGQAVRLMAADLQVAQGDHAAAEIVLAELSREGGPAAAETTQAYVMALIDQGKPVDPATLTSIAALAFEQRGTDLGAELQQTYVLALAAAGDFDSAFAQTERTPETDARLWDILARSAPDSAILTHAVVSEISAPSVPDPGVRRTLAQRLLGLGFADAALVWMPDAATAVPNALEKDRLLAARAEMLRGDGRAVLRLVAGLDSSEAAKLRAEAQAKLGDPLAAAAIFAASGDLEGEQRATRLAQEWPKVATGAEDPWRAAANLVSPELEPDSADLMLSEPVGPLATGRSAIQESAAARATLSTLLAQVTGKLAKSDPTN